jgi:hypothetical protein
VLFGLGKKKGLLCTRKGIRLAGLKEKASADFKLKEEASCVYGVPSYLGRCDSLDEKDDNNSW